jgi:hypothetical protein
MIEIPKAVVTALPGARSVSTFRLICQSWATSQAADGPGSFAELLLG